VRTPQQFVVLFVLYLPLQHVSGSTPGWPSATAPQHDRCAAQLADMSLCACM
jgi:hypothetical protein